MTNTTYEQMIQDSIAYAEKMEARPIFQTVSLLDEAYKMTSALVNRAYDNQTLTRNIWRTQYVQKHDIAQICHQIDETKDALFALIATLDQASASLANAEEKAGD